MAKLEGEETVVQAGGETGKVEISVIGIIGVISIIFCLWIFPLLVV